MVAGSTRELTLLDDLVFVAAAVTLFALFALSALSARACAHLTGESSSPHDGADSGRP